MQKKRKNSPPHHILTQEVVMKSRGATAMLFLLSVYFSPFDLVLFSPGNNIFSFFF